MKNKILIALILCFFFVGCKSDDGDESTVDAWAETEKKDALDNCISSGNPQAYCECSVEILESILSYTEFIEFDKDIRAGEKPSSEISSKMMRMSKRAVAECKK